MEPTYSVQDITNLDKYSKPVLDLTKKLYLPGFVGLNNIKANDYVNVCFQALAHVTPLRNYCLRTTKEISTFPPLCKSSIP